MPSHRNFYSEGFWNDWCWCFQKLWSPIIQGNFPCTFCRSFRDNRSDLCKSYDIVPTMISWIYIYIIYVTYIYIVHEWLSFTHGRVFFGVTSFREQSNSWSKLVEAKGGWHVGEADFPPSCCEADLRWWSLAGGLQCYDTSASNGAIGAWRRLGLTNDVVGFRVSCCTMMPSHTVCIQYIHIHLYMMIAGEPNLV